MDHVSATKFSAIREFIGRQKALGRYNGATARNLLAACSHIEPILEEGHDSVSYVQDNLDEVVRRYGNLNPNVGQASLDTYRSRIKRAIADFVGYRTDPQWQPASRAKRAAVEASEGPPQGGKAPVAAPTIAPTELAGALRHRFPLRSDFDVEIVLPRNFTAREAKRVLNWIGALASDEPEVTPD